MRNLHVCMVVLYMHVNYACICMYDMKKIDFLHEIYLNAVILKLASILCNKIYFELINIFFK